MQYGLAVVNARLDAFETTAGTAPMVRLFNHTSLPATCAAADLGTKLTEDNLPSDWLANASGGTKGKTGTAWTLHGLVGITTMNATYFRLYDTTGTVCMQQGTVTAVGGGGDATLDNISIAASQVVDFNTYVLHGGNI